MRKIAIALFIGCPMFLTLISNLIVPFISNKQIDRMNCDELDLKHSNFMKRPWVDTVICGDSTVERISSDAFLKRNWAPFNLGLSIGNSGDTAMEVAYALLYGNIRRFIIGVSFEAMADKNAFSSPVYYDRPPFADPRINQLWGLRKKQNSERSVFKKLLQVKKSMPVFWEIAKKNLRIRFKYILYKYIIHQDVPEGIDMYGRYEYHEIRRQIKNGTFDFQKNRDPLWAFSRDKEILKNKELSVEAQQIYLRMFQELRSRKIPTVVFETVKTPRYQNMIDQEPLLKELNEQWRNFFRKESYGGIKFLEAKDVVPYYYFDDFIDAVHFIGEKTEMALSEKLASELEKLENSVRN